MELFKRLDLQLLVVTPPDKIHIVEPYISAYHLVVNNKALNDSKVHNFTRDELKELKARIALKHGVTELANVS